MNYSNRSKIILIGHAPINKEPFVERGLTLESIELDTLSEHMLNDARGVVLAEPPGKFRLLGRFFEKWFGSACELGLATMVFSSEPNDSNRIIALRDAAYRAIDPTATARESELPLLADSVPLIAETLARHDPGPPSGKPGIETRDPKDKLDGMTRILLQRAFWDCDNIVVERLAGGKTAAETYRVFARIAGPMSGPRPMPFFVKTGKIEAIASEKRQYESHAEPFIPFHLRPSLNIGRCVATFPQSALVCNFVESAVSLRQALRSGQGGGAIFSLFEVTLRGLRSHTAFAKPQSGVISAFLKDRVRASEIRTGPHGQDRISSAKKLGLKRSPEELEQILKGHADFVITRRGLYHGDLHAGNVMVRNRDAIVIDFGSMGEFGPVTADLSLLEVSLIFAIDEGERDNKIWFKFVNEIFVDNSPLRPANDVEDHCPLSWLRKAVREVRHVGAGCEIDRKEALIVLAACLLRFARLSILDSQSSILVKLSETRRAYALVVAEHICSLLSQPDAKN